MSLRLSADANPPSYYDTDPQTRLGTQFWGRIFPPILDSVVPIDSGYQKGPFAELYWAPQHGGGAHYGTEVWRTDTPGNPRTTSSATATYFIEPVSGASAYTYRLRHVTTPTFQVSGITLTQPASGFVERSVTVPTPITGYIDGPDWVGTNGTYSWNAGPAGGTPPPYHFQWFYRHTYGPTLPVGSDAEDLVLEVATEEDPYAFALFVTIWDNHRFRSDAADMFLVYVDGNLPFGAPPTPEAAERRRALVAPDGSCRPFVGDRAARQALLWWIWRSGQPFRRCTPP
jgi:hypothetical protein